MKKQLVHYIHDHMADCIRTESGCLESPRSKSQNNKNGYPRVRIFGKQTILHRAVYAFWNPGDDITNKVVRHTCDNPLCIEPSHLVSGTQKDNMEDCAARGRMMKAKGEEHGRTMLSNKDVMKIKKKLMQGVKNIILAREFNVSKTTISHIKTGRSWAHI